jgi:glycopeptide antibiotics resistance protein
MFPTRRSFVLGALLFGLFVLYGSLIPFRFTQVPFGDALAEFGRMPLLPPGRLSRTDFVSNLLLFVPFGFCLAGALMVDRGLGFRVAAVPAAVAAAALLAGAVEFGQMFVRDRVASWTDVLAETVGGAIGVGLWLLIGQQAVGGAREWARSASAASSAARWLLVYLVTLAVMLLVPFDFTLRLPELAEKYREGRVTLVPFGGDSSIWLRVGRWAGDVILAAPLGALTWVAVANASRRPARDYQQVRTAIAVGAAWMLVALLEAAQLDVFSRHADVTDLVTGGAGAVLGVAVAQNWPRSARPGLQAWTALFLLYQWAPYEFTTEGLRERVSLVPLASYQRIDPLAGLTEALRKALLAAPLGMLLAGFRVGRARAAAAILCVCIVVEVGQVVVAGRYADVSDILLGAGAAWLALLAASRTAQGSPTRAPRGWP